CPFNFSFALSETLIDSGTRVKFKPELVIENDADYIFAIDYWFEDLFGNEVKARVTTTNKNTKQYTPKTDKEDQVLVLVMELNLSCANQNARREEFLIVKGREGDEECEMECVCEDECTTDSGGGSSLPPTPEQDPLLMVYVPDELEFNQSFVVDVKLKNDGYLAETFMVWAYLYRHSVSYSGEREANLQTLTVQAFGEEQLTLDINPQLVEPGEYSLKVKAIKGGRKTPYEETRTIMFLASDAIDMVDGTAAIPDEQPSDESTESADSSNPLLNPPSHSPPGHVVVEKHDSENLVTAAVAELPESRSAWFLKHGAWMAVVLAAGLYGLTKIKRKKITHPPNSNYLNTPSSPLSYGKTGQEGREEPAREAL
ncbi:MAG: hypothetical protein DRP42_06715, partial [Tenericutes bacterium]